MLDLVIGFGIGLLANVGLRRIENTIVRRISYFVGWFALYILLIVVGAVLAESAGYNISGPIAASLANGMTAGLVLSAIGYGRSTIPGENMTVGMNVTKPEKESAEKVLDASEKQHNKQSIKSEGKGLEKKAIFTKSKSMFDALLAKNEQNAEVTQSVEEARILEIDDIFFETAEYEIEHNLQNSGLWIKSSVLAEGDQAKQKAVYIRLRATQLSDEHRHKLEIKQAEEIEKEKREKELEKEKIRDDENEMVKKRAAAQFAVLQASREAGHARFVRIMVILFAILGAMFVWQVLN